MYTPAPKPDASLGLTAADFPPVVVDVWPENWAAVEAFDRMGTQWRVGMSGPTGLDYAAIPAVFRFLRVPRDRQSNVFEDVRVMETAAIEKMAESMK